jgi:hypothetical protein
MYKGRQFKHEETILSDAIGMSKQSFNQMKDISFECLMKCSSPSQIAEYLHQNADYDQILLMATFFLTDRIEEFKEKFGE